MEPPVFSAPRPSTFPGPISARMLDELAETVIATPYPFVLDIARGHGMWLVTVDGQELFDWAGYFGSKLIGHNHPGLYEPDYLQHLTVAANNKVANPDFLTRECLVYYQMLMRVAPESMRGEHLEVYAVNSGAEAVENLMKYLVAKHNAKRVSRGELPAHRRFLYFEKAFHGRTVFALGVTQTIDTVATRDFVGLTSGGNLKLPFPSIGSEHTPHEQNQLTDHALRMVESALMQMGPEIVGILIEPIQGAGGQRMAQPEFFRGLSELAHQHDVYLAFDEVQTGLGATGRMFAIDHFDLPHPPMALATGKKFGCGVLYMKDHLDDIGVLDSTWGGTLADMVRVVREMEILDSEGLVQLAAVNGERLREGLLRLAERYRPIVRNIRGMGLYQGFSTDTPERKAEIVRVARDEFGLLLLGAGHVSIRTRPNLSVTAAEVDLFLDLVEQVIRRVS